MRSIELGVRGGGEIAHPPQQPAGDARRAARAARDLVGAVRGHADLEHAGAAGDDLLQFFLGVEIEPHRNAEAIAQGIGEKARARGGADQGEFRKLDLDRARRRSLADDEVELEILHRGIEHFLDRGTEAMDFVDEEHVALFEIGQQCREIAGLGDHGTRGGAKADAELARHDLRQRGLAQSRRPDEQHVIQRLAALARGFDEYGQIGARLRLADELRQQLRTQRGVAGILMAALRRDDARGRAHFASSLSPSRISCAVSAFSPALREAAAIAAAACGWP